MTGIATAQHLESGGLLWHNRTTSASDPEAHDRAGDREEED